ncbi:hypothetical protein I4U23_004094 [Adineta vaga]|nr:hypothetical protein I4U23_004094 [Adineta vaga]
MVAQWRSIIHNCRWKYQSATQQSFSTSVIKVEHTSLLVQSTLSSKGTSLLYQTETTQHSSTMISSTNQLTTGHPPSSIMTVPVCGQHTIGLTCNISATPCQMMKPCQNNGTCVDNNTIMNTYSCLCLQGFNGSTCEYDHRPCQSNSCWNNGHCNETSNTTFECVCQSEWIGDHCEIASRTDNGALVRLAPVPLFFWKYPIEAIEFAGISGEITHGDRIAYDACRYYSALIVAALHSETKEQLLDKDFYLKHKSWFYKYPLSSEILKVSRGSYQRKGGYEGGIRGKGYIVNALEAALWAFWCDDNSFERGALAVVNLGDETGSTAAIYGQLAGAYYGYENLPEHWLTHLYARKFVKTLSKWIAYEGQQWKST